jgi:hypothetical protein
MTAQGVKNMAKITVPGTTVGLLTATSKMPSASFSLPAFKACPSAFLGDTARIAPNGVRLNVDKGTICGNCYAGKGAYAWAPVKRAQDARFKFAVAAATNPNAGDEFVSVMTAAIEGEALRQQRRFYRGVSNGTRPMGAFRAVFRVHDSGDLFSPAYAALWVRICEGLPDVDFWFPTRQWRSKNLHMLAVIHTLAALPNVSVRPSALRFEDAAPVIPGMSAGTTATATAGFTCPAPLNDGKCGDCRACWTKDIEVSYHRH